MERLVLDTNVLVRLFRTEEAQHPDAASLLLEAESGGLSLIVPDTVVVETVFILDRRYQVTRDRVALLIGTLLRHGAVDCPGREVLLDALARYARTRLDFVDCHVAAWAAATGAHACSFDKDLRKFRDIQVRHPKAG